MDPSLPDAPPEDPDDWSDQQWLDWLADTDVRAGVEPDPGWTARPRPKSTQLLYAAMFGVHQAIYGPVEQVTIVEEAAGEPDEPQSLEVHLEPEHPEESTVVLRPWLMDEPDG